MKKIICFMAILALLSMSVLAGTKIVLDPYNTNMGPNDIKNVSVCITKTLKGVTGPQANVALSATTSDANFFVTAIVSPTGSDGCGILQLQTINAPNGNYDYNVNGKISGNTIVAEIGTATAIPEFTTIGAGLALLGAGAVYFARKRK